MDHNMDSQDSTMLAGTAATSSAAASSNTPPIRSYSTSTAASLPTELAILEKNNTAAYCLVKSRPAGRFSYDELTAACSENVRLEMSSSTIVILPFNTATQSHALVGRVLQTLQSILQEEARPIDLADRSRVWFLPADALSVLISLSRLGFKTEQCHVEPSGVHTWTLRCCGCVEASTLSAPTMTSSTSSGMDPVDISAANTVDTGRQQNFNTAAGSFLTNQQNFSNIDECRSSKNIGAGVGGTKRELQDASTQQEDINLDEDDVIDLRTKRLVVDYGTAGAQKQQQQQHAKKLYDATVASSSSPVVPAEAEKCSALVQRETNSNDDSGHRLHCSVGNNSSKKLRAVSSLSTLSVEAFGQQSINAFPPDQTTANALALAATAAAAALQAASAPLVIAATAAAADATDMPSLSERTVSGAVPAPVTSAAVAPNNIIFNCMYCSGHEFARAEDCLEHIRLEHTSTMPDKVGLQQHAGPSASSEVVVACGSLEQNTDVKDTTVEHLRGNAADFDMPECPDHHQANSSNQQTFTASLLATKTTQPEAAAGNDGNAEAATAANDDNCSAVSSVKIKPDITDQQQQQPTTSAASAHKGRQPGHLTKVVYDAVVELECAQTQRILNTRQRGAAFECPVCNTELVNLVGLRNHIRTHTNEKGYACAVCGAMSNYKQSTITHIQARHCKKNDNNNRSKVMKDTFTCHFCTTDKDDAGTNSSADDDDDEEECEFDRMDQLIDHIDTAHVNVLAYGQQQQALFSCLACKQRFVTVRELGNHHNDSHVDKSLLLTSQ